MPRIIPLQLLRCLKVLLDDNGGILSAGEVKRIAGLMTKYSKKLVSKCIYVQILKCTKTELLGEFMGVGGWTLVYTWLNDAIRAMNWPLVQEILELLLLCPVDVHRLKINSAPKLVKGLCKDGGNEGVRILAKRLVEQWLKVVTENNAQVSTQTEGIAQPNTTMTPQATATRIPIIGATAPSSQIQDGNAQKNNVILRMEAGMESGPNAGNVPADATNYALSPTQKKSNETGLVYKIVVKNGQQVLAKVAKPVQPVQQEQNDDVEIDPIEEDDINNVGVSGSGSGNGNGATKQTQQLDENASGVMDEDDDSKNSHDKTNKDSESSCDDDDRIRHSKDGKSEKKDDGKESERRENRTSRDSKEREKDRKSEKEKERRSSSSHRSSSSSHKSSSKSSSSSSKSKSSSSSHRSSSDKHRSDKERSSSSSSSKDKDRKEGSSSSKHKSSSKSSSSSSSSSSSKDRHRDKDKPNSANATSTSNSKKDKEKEKELQAEKDKDTLAKVTSPSLDKLGKIPKKPKDESEPSDSPKPTSITIPSKKASISIEIRRDSEKAKTVKTYKSQFRSHGLTEEAPPPPSRKGLKKPGSTTHTPGTVIPVSLPSSLKRPSPPPRDAPTDKKAKIDLNNINIPNEKPGAIKLIAPKKIQTLVETNLFSDALSAATGPKKVIKRKRPNTPSQGKEGPSPPTSPDAPKVAPLKFYQDTLDESKTEEKSDKENEDNTNAKENSNADDASAVGAADDDDDIPLKKVKEDIEQKVMNEKKTNSDGSIDIASDQEEGDTNAINEDDDDDVGEERKPGPGCGPNGPPGVLMLHRRKGPKKKLTWRPQEQLEQIRYFELDETERVNVTKSSFNDMKNLERFGERDAINIARRGFNHEDNMQPQIQWRPLIEIENVPPHPDGSQSKEREEQAKREQTTLRALYFSHAMIPDSPAEAELQPHYPYDIPIIPLDDITGNPDAVNDFTRMPWPEPRGSPKHGDNSMAGTGGLGGLDAAVDMFGGVGNVGGPTSPFNQFINQFNVPPQQIQMQMGPGNGPQNNIWQQPPPNGAMAAAAIMGNHFNGAHMPGSPNIDMGVGPIGPMGAGAPPQNFIGPFGPAGGPFAPGNGAPFGFNGPNFGPMGGGPMMNGPGSRNNRNNNNGGNNGGWRSGSNFQDNKNNNGSGNWRPAGSGPNRGGGGGGVGNNNNGMCKAFMRGHCRLGKACKFIHPKNKRI